MLKTLEKKSNRPKSRVVVFGDDANTSFEQKTTAHGANNLKAWTSFKASGVATYIRAAFQLVKLDLDSLN